jgi:hypothetical protein
MVGILLAVTILFYDAPVVASDMPKYVEYDKRQHVATLAFSG